MKIHINWYSCLCVWPYNEQYLYWFLPKLKKKEEKRSYVDEIEQLINYV